MNTPPPLVLATQSIARAHLMRAAGYVFEQIPSGADEPPIETGESPQQYVIRLATLKARAVAAHKPDAVILAADTVSFLDGHILGKPRDLEAAVRMLQHEAGRTHDLCTGICVMAPHGQGEWTEADTVKVTMRAWTETQIRRHVAMAEPLKYAGAYALQEEGCVMVERIEGDPNTVIGLPMTAVERCLAACGIVTSYTL